jgi:hypothetical protein
MVSGVPKYTGCLRQNWDFVLQDPEFFVLNLTVMCFLSLKSFKNLKVTTFRGRNLSSSSAKKGRTPSLLDPVHRATLGVWTNPAHNSPFFFYLKTKKDSSFET